MTFIQPSKNSSVLNRILAVLIAGSILGGIALVVLYNRTVNFKHGFNEMKAELAALQLENAEIKDKIFKLVDAGNDSQLLGDFDLIEDKNPQYLEIGSKWFYASGF